MMAYIMLHRANYDCIFTFIGFVQYDPHLNEALHRRCLIHGPALHTGYFVRPWE